MNFRFSIYIKIAFFLFLSLSIILLIRLQINNITTTKNYEKQIKEKHLSNFERLKKIVNRYLWSYDYNSIEEILNNELAGIDEVIYIKLTDLTAIGNKTVYEKIKLSSNFIVDYDENFYRNYLNQYTFIQYEDKITYNFENIGEITIIISSERIKKQIDEINLNALKDTILYFFIIIVVLFIGMKIIIIDPIIKLNKDVNNMIKNNFFYKTKVKSRDEIGTLANTFNYLADSIYEKNLTLLNKIYFDQLTDLPNRVKFLEDIKKVSKGAVLIINIDSFQEINDFYGYEVGDAILVEIARKLKTVQSKYKNTIYRLQSDEFALLINEEIKESTFNEEIKMIIIQFVFATINDSVIIINDSEISIRATVGVSKVTPSDNYKALYNADMALKKAKQLQKHYIIYDESLQIAKEYENNIKWSFILKEAIENDKIVPYFQPIVNNTTNIIEKYECLCRLINRNNDIISPYYFLDIAKKNRTYPTITKRIIYKSFEAFENLDYEFSINLSIVDILNEETRKYIKSIIMSNQKTAKRLVFEILESEGLENFETIKTFIDDVKSFGCKIAIDDFGSGYSNFDHIITLDVDYIKIDASMIKNIDTNRESQIISKTIVNFSKELDIKTIAEYVHSQNVYKKVKELGIDYSQGFFFGEPVQSIL